MNRATHIHLTAFAATAFTATGEASAAARMSTVLSGGAMRSDATNSRALAGRCDAR